MSTTATQSTRSLRQIKLELETLSEKLRSPTRPMHVDYISKANASSWAAELAASLTPYIAAAEGSK